MITKSALRMVRQGVRVQLVGRTRHKKTWRLQSFERAIILKLAKTPQNGRVSSYHTVPAAFADFASCVLLLNNTKVATRPSIAAPLNQIPGAALLPST